MARDKKQRIDVSSERDNLTDNPFASLASQVADDVHPLPSETPKPKAEIMPVYTITRSRKGNWPVRIEKRGGGKIVTIVENVSGDGKAFLKALQKTLGTGGKVDGETILIQGDQVAKVERFLDSTTPK